MRVLVGSIGHESNTFSPLPTRLVDFRIALGNDILGGVQRDSLAGIADTLVGAGHELIPAVRAGALPGGLVQREAFDRLLELLLAQADEAQGACVFLHGAMRAEGVDYGDTALLHALRERLGPNAPITVAMDMHANITAQLVQDADGLAAYHTAPHIDRYETGQRAAELFLHRVDGGRLSTGFAKIPMLLPGEMAQSDLEPMAGLMRMVTEIEALPGVLDCSLSKTHCWADVPDQGISAVVVTDGDPALAQAQANRLASAFWDQRRGFALSAEAYPPAQAVQVALDAPEETVFLSDAGDNPGAGGTTDVPTLLQALLDAGATNTLFAAIWDAQAFDACAAAGVGAEVTLTLAGKIETRCGPPIPVTGRMRTLSDGTFFLDGVQDDAHRASLGPVAVLALDGVDVVISRERTSIIDPRQLRALGLEPLAYRIVVLKRGYLTAPFQAISERVILVLSPGPTNCDVTQLDYVRANRPLYPLDEDATWSAN